ncbi:HNH endonuclease [Bacillus paranthracis]
MSKKQGFYQYKENEKKITIYYLYLVDSYLFSLNSFGERKMQLVPYGIHGITVHNGGRTKGMWADAPR